MANYNNNQNNAGVERVVNKMLTNSVKFKLQAVKYSVTTRDLGESMCGIFADTMGIHEIDHIAIYPIRDERNNIIDFGVDAIFNLDKRIDKERTITRFGNNDAANIKDNPVMRAMAAKTRTGGFHVTDKFKKAMAPLAVTDDNGNIKVMADPSNDKRLAMVECDFLSIMTLALGIDENDPIDFEVVNCQPVNNNDKNVDFIITVEKTVQSSAFNKHRRSSINYEARDRARMNDRRNRR